MNIYSYSIDMCVFHSEQNQWCWRMTPNNKYCFDRLDIKSNIKRIIIFWYVRVSNLVGCDLNFNQSKQLNRIMRIIRMNRSSRRLHGAEVLALILWRRWASCRERGGARIRQAWLWSCSHSIGMCVFHSKLNRRCRRASPNNDKCCNQWNINKLDA